MKVILTILPGITIYTMRKEDRCRWRIVNTTHSYGASCSSSTSPPGLEDGRTEYKDISTVILLLVIPRHILPRAPLETPDDICAKHRLLRPPPLSFSRKASPQSTPLNRQAFSYCAFTTCTIPLYTSLTTRRKKWPLLHPRSEPLSSSPSAFRHTQHQHNKERY